MSEKRGFFDRLKEQIIEKPDVEPTKEVPQNSFTTQPGFSPSFTPQSNFTPSQPSMVSSDIQRILDEQFTNHLTSINQPGVDFYEFMESVEVGDINSPQTFAMAFKMLANMEKSLTKERLIQQADEYLSKINDLYQHNLMSGENKKQSLNIEKENEKQSLSNDLTGLKEQLLLIQSQILDRENKLRDIESKYQPKLNDVVIKLQANSVSNNKLVDKITKIKNGIISNVK
jgi:hypothetical protein